jgi:hypothetical protein
MLPVLLQAMVNLWSSNPNIKGDYQRDKEATTEKIDRCARAFCDAWSNTDKTVFNKSRGWATNITALQRVYPDAKAIVVVRDPREVFASFERQHQKNPLFNIMEQRTLLDRAHQMFSRQGMIGSCIAGIRDVVDRQQDVFFVKYEDFVRHPVQVMERLYCYLDLPSFEHDFEDVVNTATDPDYLFLDKYPHEGSGKVAPRAPTWPKVMSREISQGIVDGNPWFFKEFKYVQTQQRDEETIQRLKNTEAQ